MTTNTKFTAGEVSGTYVVSGPVTENAAAVYPRNVV